MIFSSEFLGVVRKERLAEVVILEVRFYMPIHSKHIYYKLRHSPYHTPSIHHEIISDFLCHVSSSCVTYCDYIVPTAYF